MITSAPRRWSRVLCFAVVLACASAMSGVVSTGGAKAWTFPDFCATVAPNAKLTLGAGVPQVSAVSNGGGYFVNPCYKFVTDITVPWYSSGGPGYFNSFSVGAGLDGAYAGDYLPLSQSACTSYAQYTAVYSKTFLSTGFVFLGGGWSHGHWSPGGLLGS